MMVAVIWSYKVGVIWRDILLLLQGIKLVAGGHW